MPLAGLSRGSLAGNAVAYATSMLARLGFVASVLTENLSTSRTCRLRYATADRLRELTARNLHALEEVFRFLDKRRIRLCRISSNLIPYASHEVNAIPWWEEHADTLRRLGRRLRRLGIRVSTHPGQYTVLNSPHRAVVEAAVTELRYHARLLDALGTPASAKIVLHIGGLYGECRPAALDRFVAAVHLLPPAVKRRLVVENDDRLFDADDALQGGRRAGIPVVFDWLHHRSNPCARPVQEVVAEIFQTWRSGHGRPKIHLSSQARGAPRGAHADYVSVRDLIAFMGIAPQEPFDCMLEAKQKDRALLRLRDQLARRGIIELDLRAGSSRAGPSRSAPTPHRG